MHKNKSIIVFFLGITIVLTGCNTQQTPQTTPTPATTQTTTDANSKADQIIKDGLPGFGPAMRGVSDSFDNMYYAAKGGNWALAAYMGDVMGDYMSPTQISRTKDYPQWDSFYKANLGDDGALRKAMSSKDFSAFDKAYSATISNCNACHAGLGFKFIQKIKASAPEANLDYSVKSDASENK